MCQEELTYIFIYFYWRNPDQHINKQSYHSIIKVVSPLISYIILQRHSIWESKRSIRLSFFIESSMFLVNYIVLLSYWS